MSAQRPMLLISCLLVLLGCQRIDYELSRGDLPNPAGDRGGPAPVGNIAYQPPFLPITFSIGTDGSVSVSVNARIVTPLGTITLSGGIATRVSDDTVLAAEPSDVTQIIICQANRCTAYELASGHKMRIEMNGQFVQEIERNRIVINSAGASSIVVTDLGAPSTDTKARGPARVAIEDLMFSEYGSETEVDLERSRGGTTADAVYDHVSGDLRLINGTQIALLRTTGHMSDGSYGRPTSKDVPTEFACQETAHWTDVFDQTFTRRTTIACIKTAEADLGYIVIWPEDSKAGPSSFRFYSHVWVR